MGRTEQIRYRHKQLFALHMNLSILEDECWELPEQNNNCKILKFNNFKMISNALQKWKMCKSIENNLAV